MSSFMATNSIIPDRIKKRMSRRRVSPLVMGVSPHLLLKETEEFEQLESPIIRIKLKVFSNGSRSSRNKGSDFNCSS